jgi:hypothetical protein
MSETATHDPKLNEDEAARHIGVRPQTLANWRCHRRYDLPFIRVGRLIRYRLSDLDRWLESRTVGADDETNN